MLYCAELRGVRDRQERVLEGLASTEDALRAWLHEAISQEPGRLLWNANEIASTASINLVKTWTVQANQLKYKLFSTKT